MQFYVNHASHLKKLNEQNNALATDNSSSDVANSDIIFTIKGAKLYVPLVTLSMKG